MEVAHEKPTIYFIWNYLNWGGAQIYFLAIINAALAEWNVTVIVPRGSSEELLRFLNETDVNIEFLENSLDLTNPPSIAGKIHRQLRRVRSEREIVRRIEKIDRTRSVVHIELAPWQSWQLLVSLSLLGTRVFVTMHNFPSDVSPIRRAMWKIRLKIVSNLPRLRIFASNQDTKLKFRNWFTPSFWEEIDVTYTSIDPVQIDEAKATADRTGLRRKLNIPESDVVVLAVGQFVDRKGRWVFLEAGKAAADRIDNIRFLWMMPLPPERSDTERVESFRLDDRFRPVISSEFAESRLDVLRFFHVADIFALPSYVEGLPIALLEAMASGLPSIATDVNAIPEAIKNGETGLLVKAGDPAMLADAIETLAKDLGFRKRLSEAGRLHVLERFSVHDMSRIVLARYREAIRERND